MHSAAEVRAITRRFLQCRRRGQFHMDEIRDLLAADVEYVERIDGSPVAVVGAEAVESVMRRYTDGLGPGARMAVIRHELFDDGTAVGHWRREADGVVINGRDTYTVRDGRICRIEVEEFPGVTVPELVLNRPMAEPRSTTPRA